MIKQEIVFNAVKRKGECLHKWERKFPAPAHSTELKWVCKNCDASNGYAERGDPEPNPNPDLTKSRDWILDRLPEWERFDEFYFWYHNSRCEGLFLEPESIVKVVIINLLESPTTLFGTLYDFITETAK